MRTEEKLTIVDNIKLSGHLRRYINNLDNEIMTEIEVLENLFLLMKYYGIFEPVEEKYLIKKIDYRPWEKEDLKNGKKY